MASLTPADARAFFLKCADEVQSGDRLLFAAFIDNELVGTVQVVLAMPPNQPHRADVAKLLVHRRARGQGVAAGLMAAAEEASVRAGKSLLVLDTAAGSVAERLYDRLGWTRAGTIPDYALLPDGELCGTTIFWKRLGQN